MTMDNQDTINKEREIADDKMITAAFDKLMKTYLDSPHRKKVDIITQRCKTTIWRTIYHAPYCRCTDSMRGDGAWINKYLCCTPA